MESLKLKNNKYWDTSGVFDHEQLKTQEEINAQFAKDFDNIEQTLETSNVGPASIASFNAAMAGKKLKGLTVDIEPLQDLHGYDHPWPGGGGKNLLPVTVESKTVNGVTFTVEKDDSGNITSIKASGTATANISSAAQFASVLLPAGTYKANGLDDGGPAPSYRLTFYNQGASQLITNIYQGADNEFTLSEATTVVVYPVILKDTTVTNVVYKPMIRLATETDATFEPYSNICPITGWTGCNVTRTGKNLLNRDAYTTGKTLNDTGEIIDSGASTSVSEHIPVVAGAQYTFSCNTVSTGYKRVAAYTKDGAFIAPLLAKITGIKVGEFRSVTFTTPANAAYLIVGNNTQDTDVQLELGSTATEYEPYQDDTYYITFPTEAGTVYGGTLDVVNKKLTVEYEKYVLTPDLTYAPNSDRPNALSVYVNIPSQSNDVVNLYCNQLKVMESGARDSTVPAINMSASKYALVIAFPKPTVETYADVTNKIIELYNAGTPIEVVYKLQTPIVYDLSDIHEITTLLGINNIWADAGYVTVTYGAYLDEIDESIKDTDAKTESVLNAVKSEELAGSIATFDASVADMPLKGLTVNIEPVQDLHGYDYPWPAGGGKNLLKYPYAYTTRTSSGITWTDNGDGSITVNGTSTANVDFYFILTSDPLPLSNGNYLFSSTYTGVLPSDGFYIHAKANQDDSSYLNIGIGEEDTYTVTNEVFYTACIRVLSGRTVNNVTVRPMLRFATETDATYEPYSNICHITGWTGCNINTNGKNFMQVTLATMKRINTSGVWTDNKYTNNSIAFTVDTDDNGYVTAIVANGTASGDANINLNGIPSQLAPLPTNTRCRISGCPDGGSGNTYRLIAYLFHNSTYLNRMAQDVGNGTLFGSENANNYYARINIKSGVTASNLVFTPMIQLATDSSQAFEPYQGNTYDITFPTEAGTVYGGTLDVVNKKLIVDKAGHIFTGTETFKTDITSGIGYITEPKAAHKGNGGSTTIASLMCSHLNPSLSYLYHDRIDRTNRVFPWYNNNNLFLLLGYPTGVTSAEEYESYLQQQYAAGTPVTVCYPLDAPIVYDLTADEITTILGENNIWADTGDVTVTYGAYLETVKAYAEKVGDSILSAIAPLETSYIATRGYAVGTYLFVGAKFYKVTAAIAKGGTITPGTNVFQTTVAMQLIAHSRDIATLVEMYNDMYERIN